MQFPPRMEIEKAHEPIYTIANGIAFTRIGGVRDGKDAVQDASSGTVVSLQPCWRSQDSV